ncbi:MAG: sugar phosphate isomerase/epimerase [Planctomycetes bacterium]|nr:sugar phosphate isomerase/epimerase [Planctomycetota bacterium]
MRLAYNTNGLAHHRLDEALDLCAELGYGGVAITLDVAHLDPFGDWIRSAEKVRAQAASLGLTLAVETGARFLLDPRRKHAPNLLSKDPGGRQRRIDFYKRSIEVAQALGASVVSLWSGAADSEERVDDGSLYDRLIEGLIPVLELARSAGVSVCFEPEPGMFIERVDQFHTLKERAQGSLADLKMTLDVGHCLVTGEIHPDRAIRENAAEIGHVHLDDIRGGVHEHILFGEGDLDLRATLCALEEIAFAGMAAVELSRDSHRGAWAASEAMQRLMAARPN